MEASTQEFIPQQISEEEASPKKAESKLNPLEQFLFGSRMVVMIAIFASLVLSFGIFYVATVDTFYIVVGNFSTYADPLISSSDRDTLRSEVIGKVVSTLDTYLIGSVLLIFAIGLYNLFIHPTISNEDEQSVPTLPFARFKSLDDLKDQLAKLVLLIIQIDFFKRALKMEIQTLTELLLMGVAILLLSLTIYLSQKKEGKGDKGSKPAAPATYPEKPASPPPAAPRVQYADPAPPQAAVPPVAYAEPSQG